MTTTATVISGFGIEFTDIEIGFSDDKDYYEAIGCDIWDTDFKKHGLDVILEEDKLYVGIFATVSENLSFDMLFYNFEKSFSEIEKDYTNAKYAFFKLLKEHPEFSDIVGDVRNVKMINRILYS